MASGNQKPELSAKDHVIQNSKKLLDQAQLWALIRVDEKGAIHIHAESKTQFLALMLGVFTEEPELKEDLDMMLKFEAHQKKLKK